jgi:hypothetical protein
LQHLPDRLYANKFGPSRKRHFGAAAGATVPNFVDAPAVAAATPRMRALNNCSARLYARWLERFDARLRAMPAAFRARAAKVPTSPPLIRARAAEALRKAPPLFERRGHVGVADSEAANGPRLAAARAERRARMLARKQAALEARRAKEPAPAASERPRDGPE